MELLATRHSGRDPAVLVRSREFEDASCRRADGHRIPYGAAVFPLSIRLWASRLHGEQGATR
jgi:hypothetical protein